VETFDTGEEALIKKGLTVFLVLVFLAALLVGYNLLAREASQLAPGEKKVIQEGIPDVKENKNKIAYKKAEKAGRKAIRTEAAEPQPPRMGAHGDRAGKVISRGGRDYKPVKEIPMEVTAYTHTGSVTATGTVPAKGTVAVDPRVIPLGTRLYIEGYGFGVARDTGGEIKGNRLDVFFETREKALKWGRKEVKVTILREIK